MIIEERKMNLFDCECDAYIHCISQDCAMGKGIAKTFKKEYPYMKRALIKDISETKSEYPFSIIYFGREKPNVINMVTKEKYYHKPTYESFSSALSDVKCICEYFNFKTIAMPKIGCGLDRLEWDKVKRMIEEMFKDMNINIIVCYL